MMIDISRHAGPVLVTGASGFIGRRLLERLARRQADVHAVSRTPPEDLAGQATWHAVDLTDAVAARELVAAVKPSIIFNLASLVKGARDLDLVLPMLHANLTSAVHLLEAASRTSCQRFVQVGSLEEPSADQVSEAPSSPYAAAKAAATAYARMFHRLYDTPVVIARLFMVYGPGYQDTNKLVPYVINQLLAGNDPNLSSGDRPVDWIHVDDVVEGLVRLATTPGIEGQRIDLGSGALHTVRQVVEQIYQLIAPDREPQFGSRADRKAEQVRRSDIAATEATLGWRPEISLRNGLKSTIDYFTSGASHHWI